MMEFSKIFLYFIGYIYQIIKFSKKIMSTIFIKTAWQTKKLGLYCFPQIHHPFQSNPQGA
jgi:hypothetical protein